MFSVLAELHFWLSNFHVHLAIACFTNHRSPIFHQKTEFQSLPPTFSSSSQTSPLLCHSTSSIITLHTLLVSITFRTIPCKLPCSLHVLDLPLFSLSALDPNSSDPSSLLSYFKQVVPLPRKTRFSTLNELLSPFHPDSFPPNRLSVLAQLPAFARRRPECAGDELSHPEKARLLPSPSKIHISVFSIP